MTTLSIIIPNLNGEKFLSDCLNSLDKSIKLAKSKANFEIILVDNASSDHSCQFFTNFCTKNKIKFQTIKLDKNYGFAGAINRGVTRAKSAWVVLCNNDLKIETNWFSLIIDCMEKNNDSKLAAITGTVLSYDGTKIESQGLKFFYSGKCDNISNGLRFSSSVLTRQRSNSLIWGASAALTVYHKGILDKVGGFDEAFFAYQEDVDLSLRLHNLSYKTLYVPKALCYHLGGGTSSKMGNFRHRMYAKNWIYIIIKNYSKTEITKNIFPIIEQRLRNFSGLVKSTPTKEILPSIFNTYGEVIRNFPQMISKRKEIKKLSSLKEI